jgi:exonuclease SbcC
MRIVAIRGSNLASLKGDFAIELDQPPLVSLGLFAIHGPVGSGKSTILDALTLALFGRTPRLSGTGGALLSRGDDDDDPLRSNDPATLVRRGVALAHAEVDFVGQDGRLYRARWDVRRGRGSKGRPGRLQPGVHRLTDLASATVLGDGNTEVRRLISQALGLSFEELCRSVLLAQGGFQGFLLADPKERAELLEKVTGTEVYSRLGAAAFARARDIENRLAALQDHLARIAVVDDAGRTQLETDLVRHGSDAASTEVWVRSLQHQLSRAEATERLRQTTRELEVAQRRAEHALAAEASARARDDQATQRLAQATPAALDYERAVRARAARQARWVQAQTRARAADDVVAAARTRHHDAHESAARARAKAQDARHALEGLVAAVDLSADDDVATRVLARARALTALKEARDTVDGAAVIVAAAQQDCIAAAQALAACDDTAAAWLERARGLVPADLDLGDFDDATASVAAAVVEAASAALEQVQAAIETRTANVERLQETMSLETNRRWHLAARAALVDGEPCPVCGSADHPARSRSHDVFYGDAAVSRAEALDARLASEHQALRELHAARAGHEARIASVGARVGRRPMRVVITAPASLPERLALLARLDEAAPVVRRVLEATTARSTANAALEAARAAHGAQLVVRDAAAARVDLALADVDALDDDVAQGTREALLARLQALRSTATALVHARERVAAADVEVEACVRAESDALRALERAESEAQTHTAMIEAAVDELRVADDDLSAATAALRALGADEDIDGFVASVRRDVDGTSEMRQRAEREAREADVARAALQERAREQAEHVARLGGPVLGAGEVDVVGLPAALEAARVRVERCRELAAAARARLAHDDVSRAERQRVTEELERAREDGEAWRAVSSLIGSKDGDRFRQFAQGLTLDALVTHANEHLHALAPRYRLRRTKSEHHRHDLDLAIIDAESGFDVRSTNTLSGGESFLVSLALALGLSSLTTNEGARGRVESLFIDEGFSALDQETLDVALAAFDTLRQSGRQIGVISHVPLLVERIGAQVRVVPVGGGASRVEIATD